MTDDETEPALLDRLERDLSTIEVAMRHVDEGDLAGFDAIVAQLDEVEAAQPAVVSESPSFER